MITEDYLTGRLKERKDIVENPQKYGLEKQLQSTLKTEWNEEDEKMCQNILECLKNGWKKLPTDILKYESWLKSPKYQNCWKPTKEQMRALHDMNLTGNISYVGQGQTLIELYNDLKKL